MTACRHGRSGMCVYCLCRISPHDFYEMMRFRAELRRPGKRHRGHHSDTPRESVVSVESREDDSPLPFHTSNGSNTPLEDRDA